MTLAPVYAFVAVAVFAAGGEYRGGQIRVSLAAVPDRDRFFAAKLLATLVVAAAAAVPVLLPGHLIRHLAAGGGPGAAGMAAALLAEVTAYLLLSLVGHGFAVIARSAVTPLAVLVVAAIPVSPMLGGVLPEVVRLLPHEATLSFLGMPADPALTLPGPAGAAVLSAWAVLSAGAAWARTVRRDNRPYGSGGFSAAPDLPGVRAGGPRGRGPGGAGRPGRPSSPAARRARRPPRG